MGKIIMTPKEKAKELVDIYYDILPNWVNIDDAKQCALIAVGLLLEEMFFEDEPKYWQQVKKEIEKL